MNKGRREEPAFQMWNSIKRPRNGNLTCFRGLYIQRKKSWFFIDHHSSTPGGAHIYVLLSGARLHWFKSNNCHLITGWSWVSYLTSLCVCFLICKIRIIVVAIFMELLRMLTELLQIKLQEQCLAHSELWWSELLVVRQQHKESIYLLRRLLCLSRYELVKAWTWCQYRKWEGKIPEEKD